MKELFRLIPRKYRSLAVRLSLLLLCLLLICLFLTPESDKTGAGKSDQSLFRFDYDTDGNDVYIDQLAGYDDTSQEEAVAPAKHRGEDFEKLAETREENGNFTVAPLLKPEVSNIFRK